MGKIKPTYALGEKKCAANFLFCFRLFKKPAARIDAAVDLTLVAF